MAPSSHQDPLLGTTIDDRYVVHEVLGRGGMGVVYGGVHEKLGREVAIKVLAAGLGTDSVAAQRFLREARIASNLSHGTIVDVSDLGQLPDGRPYLIMPRVQGIDFAALLTREGPLPLSRVVELLRGVASALDLVHAKGLVHRDVKPENLMHVIREDGSQTVMLLDFGIATLLGPEVARLTAEGRIVGTPAYLPPELVRGDEPDRRGDIYALATVAFELITGRLPYVADNPMRLLPMKMMYDPPRMGLVMGHDLPEPIEAEIARGLARDPARRHATASELINALDRAVRAHLPAPSDPAPRVAHTVAEAAPSRTISEQRVPALDSREMSLEDVQVDANGNSARGHHAATAPPRSAGAVPLSDDDAIVNRTTLGVETGGDGGFALPRSTTRRPAFLIGAGLLALIGVTIVLGRRGDPTPAVTAHSEPPGPPRAPEPAPAPAAPAPAPTAEAPKGVDVPSAEQRPAVPAAAHPRPGKPARPPRTAAATTPAPASTPKPASDALAAVRPAEPSADELNRQAAGELVQGHLARAAELYQRAAHAGARSAAAWRGVAVTNERLGKRDVALNAYRRALQLTPAGPQADSMRARVEQLQH